MDTVYTINIRTHNYVETQNLYLNYRHNPRSGYIALIASTIWERAIVCNDLSEHKDYMLKQEQKVDLYI